MILKAAAKACNRELHPHFEKFDHAVTVLVFADIAHKVWHGLKWIF